MSKAMEQLRASLLDQEKQTKELIRSSKAIQKELRGALSSTEAALEEGERVLERMKDEYPAPEPETISDKDKERIAKLLLVIEKEAQAGPKPDTKKLIRALEEDTLIDSLSSGEGSGEKSASGLSHSQKKGHIAL